VNPGRLHRLLRRRRPVVTALNRSRRRALLTRLRLQEVWLRARVDASISTDVALGRGVRVEVEPGTSSVLRIGSGATIGNDVRIRLEGGALLIGPDVEIRRQASLVVGGRLQLKGRNLLQAGCSLHCAQEVTVGHRAVLSEYATVVDSSHHFSTPDRWFLDNVRTGPVRIGDEVWIGAKATVGRGVTVGDQSVVSANSLVVRDVPPGHLASGVPAEVRRAVVLPAPAPPGRPSAPGAVG
jgi:acetyltransferase-like isoleucine patch superfamily enzyme